MPRPSCSASVRARLRRSGRGAWQRREGAGGEAQLVREGRFGRSQPISFFPFRSSPQSSPPCRELHGLRLRRPACAVAQGAQPGITPRQLATSLGELRNSVEASLASWKLVAAWRVLVQLGRWQISHEYHFRLQYTASAIGKSFQYVMAGVRGTPNRMATTGRWGFLRSVERRKCSRDAPLEPVLKGYITVVNIVPHNQVVEAYAANTKCRRGGETAVPRPRTPTPGVWTRSRRPLVSTAHVA